jgi:hypothetical protein
VVLVLAVGGGTVWAMQGSGSPKTTSAAATGKPQAAPGSAAPASADPGAPSTSDAPSPSASTPSAGPKAADQAKALDSLLSQGESAKAPIGSAVAKVKSCPAKADIDSSAQVFDDAAKQRDTLLASLGKLDFGDLPGGADAAASLKAAWQQSAAIDRAYEGWAKDVSSQGCTKGVAPNTANLKNANDLNPQATQSKKDFVAKWGPIAGAYNLASRTWDRI